MLFLTISMHFSVCAIGHGVSLKKLPLRNSTENLAQYFSPRIVGGTDVSEGSAPYMVALVVGETVTTLACGGAIVSPRLVLTGAQCIDRYIIWNELLPSYHGVVGTNRWHSGGYNVYFKGFHMHPQWDRPSLLNDIGFLPLDKDLTWSSTVGMIGINLDFIEGGEPSYVNGWGLLNPFTLDGVLAEKLQRLNVSTLSDESCIASFQQFGIQIFPAVEICAVHSFGHGLCYGDAGSPLISVASNTIIGLGVWGVHCAMGHPDVYTRVSEFKDFVLDIKQHYK